MLVYKFVNISPPNQIWQEVYITVDVRKSQEKWPRKGIFQKSDATQEFSWIVSRGGSLGYQETAATGNLDCEGLPTC